MSSALILLHIESLLCFLVDMKVVEGPECGKPICDALLSTGASPDIFSYQAATKQLFFYFLLPFLIFLELL